MSDGPDRTSPDEASPDAASPVETSPVETSSEKGAPTVLGESDHGCGEVVHRLYHFLDGELTEERRAAIRAHLDDCGPCLDAFDFEAELRQVVASRCRDRVPDSLRERVATSIRHAAELESDKQPR